MCAGWGSRLSGFGVKEEFTAKGLGFEPWWQEAIASQEVLQELLQRSVDTLLAQKFRPQRAIETKIS